MHLNPFRRKAVTVALLPEEASFTQYASIYGAALHLGERGGYAPLCGYLTGSPFSYTITLTELVASLPHQHRGRSWCKACLAHALPLTLTAPLTQEV
jgi:hypothetical protein